MKKIKVCYFIQAHNHPEQVYRLVRTIKKSSPNSLIVIGYDFTNSAIDMSVLKDLSDVFLLKSNFVIKRGELSILQPYLNVINWLFTENRKFDWLVYISGQDYPIQSAHKIEKKLLETQYDGFIEYFDVLFSEKYCNKNHGKSRYFYQYYTFPNNQFLKIILNLLHKFKIIKLLRLKFTINFLNNNDIKVGIPPKKMPFNNKNICYGGNHRHILSHKCVEFIKCFIDANPALIKYYKKTLLPEESLIQTILVNSHQFNLYNHPKIYDDYNYFDGKKHNGHPKILTIEDYPKIINSKAFFARKFEPDSEVLDLLDSHIFSAQVHR